MQMYNRSKLMVSFLRYTLNFFCLIPSLNPTSVKIFSFTLMNTFCPTGAGHWPVSRTRYFTCSRAMESQSTGVSPLRNFSAHCSSSTDGLASTAHTCHAMVPQLIPKASTALSSNVPRCSPAFLSCYPRRLAMPCSHTSSPARAEQCSSSAVHTAVFFPHPPSLLLFARPFSLLLRTCNALALIVTPLSSPSFPLYSPSSLSLLILVWVFRTPYGSAGQLSLSDRCRPAAEVTLPACLLFSDKNNLADFDSQHIGVARELLIRV